MNLLQRFLVVALIGLAAHTGAALEIPNYEIKRDVVYGHKDGMALIYDAILQRDGNGAAVAFMMSGGWFSNWGPTETRLPMVKYLLDRDISVFLVYHGSAPRFKVPDAVADVKRAIRHITAHSAGYGVNPAKLAVMGGSAGGHLSLMIGLSSDDGIETATDPLLQVANHVGAVVAYFPPVDLAGLVGPSDSFPALEFDVELTEDVSPINFVSSDDPAVLLVHGDQDELVPIQHSERMHAALSDVGVVSEFVTIEGATHGFLGEHRQQAQDAVIGFLEKTILK